MTAAVPTKLDSSKGHSHPSICFTKTGIQIPCLGLNLFGQERSEVVSFEAIRSLSPESFLQQMANLYSCIQYILRHSIANTKLSLSEFRIFLILLNRACLSDDVKQFIEVTWHNVAMVIVTGFLIAGKMLNDSCLRNSFWSQLFHLDLASVNESELCMLRVMEWDVTISEEEWLQSGDLVERMVLIGEHHDTPVKTLQ